MTTQVQNKEHFAQIFQSHIATAMRKKIIQWNDGLNYTDFIQALWRVFKFHEDFKADTEKILHILTEEDAIALLADQIDVRKLKSA